MRSVLKIQGFGGEKSGFGSSDRNRREERAELFGVDRLQGAADVKAKTSRVELPLLENEEKKIQCRAKTIYGIRITKQELLSLHQDQIYMCMRIMQQGPGELLPFHNKMEQGDYRGVKPGFVLVF